MDKPIVVDTVEKQSVTGSTWSVLLKSTTIQEERVKADLCFVFENYWSSRGRSWEYPWPNFSLTF